MVVETQNTSGSRSFQDNPLHKIHRGHNKIFLGCGLGDFLTSRARSLGQRGTPMGDKQGSRSIYLQGIHWWNNRNYDKALVCFQRAHELFPQNPFIMSYLGLARVKMRAVEEGLELCQQALKRKPFNEHLLYNLGQAYRLAGNRQEARRAFILGAKIAQDSKRFLNALKEMGVRRKPVIPFLSRDHVLNRWLGKLTYKPGQFRIEDVEN